MALRLVSGRRAEQCPVCRSARATDRAGHTVQASATVTVNLDAPTPITLTLTSDVSGGNHVLPGTTLRAIPAGLTLTWQSNHNPADMLPYQIHLDGAYHPNDTNPGHRAAGRAIRFTIIAGEAQRIEAAVTSRFTDGNRQVDSYGPVYVDTPYTPDYIDMGDHEGRPYSGWMDSGCSLVGVDRRAQQHAQGGAAVDSLQRLYVTWDAQALRLAWTGANWRLCRRPVHLPGCAVGQRAADDGLQSLHGYPRHGDNLAAL